VRVKVRTAEKKQIKNSGKQIIFMVHLPRE